MNSYRCNWCGYTVERDSAKRWIRSWCERTGKLTRLWRVDK
jgi:DNA-directed RNA polymerase subunit RPC12/RpoP